MPRWVSFPARTILAVLTALLFAGLTLPASGVSAQNLAIPACNDALNLGQAATDSCLRVVNANVVDKGPIDVYLGDGKIVDNLEYGKATKFAAIPSGAQRLRVVAAGTAVDQAPFDMTNTLRPGAAYQMTVIGLDQAGEAPWLSGVDVTALRSGQARVRVVNASPDTNSIDVSVAGDRTPFAGIASGSQSGYVPFNAGSFTFEVRQSGTDTLLVSTPDQVPIEEGMNYDLYVAGLSQGGTLELWVFPTKVGVIANATPAAAITPIVAVGATPILVTPGAEPPVPTPTS